MQRKNICAKFKLSYYKTTFRLLIRNIKKYLIFPLLNYYIIIIFETEFNFSKI